MYDYAIERTMTLFLFVLFTCNVLLCPVYELWRMYKTHALPQLLLQKDPVI